MENKNVNYLVMAFLFLIIGVALIGSVASSINSRTDKTVVVNESHDLTGCVVPLGGTLLFGVNESLAACNITVTNAPTDWKVTDCPLTSVTVGNATLDFTDGTEYNLLASSGVIQMLNITATQFGYVNTTLVDYTYCADDYLNSGWGRSVLLTIPGFFALALLGVALWLFYSVFKNTGLIKQ